MKTIIKNQKNVIECECGKIFEVVTIKKDYSFLELKNNPDLVEVGFQKEVELKNGQKIIFEVIGKKHDINVDGKKTSLSFASRDLFEFYDGNNYAFRMNITNTNNGSWAQSYLRNALNSKILSLFPDSLVELIEIVKKYNYCDDKIVATEDKLWIPSGNEVFGKNEYTSDNEGEQYELFKYYKNRIKGYLSNGYSNWYWLRSPYVGSSSYFASVGSSGALNVGIADEYNGVSPCFAI